jgi:ribosome modulation factor
VFDRNINISIGERRGDMTEELKLRLALAFDEGYNAHQAGKKLRDNPYSIVMGHGTDEELLYDQWIEGWYQAGSDE